MHNSFALSYEVLHPPLLNASTFSDYFPVLPMVLLLLYSPSIYLSVYLSIYLFIYLSICPTIYSYLYFYLSHSLTLSLYLSDMYMYVITHTHTHAHTHSYVVDSGRQKERVQNLSSGVSKFEVRLCLIYVMSRGRFHKVFC